MIARINKWVCMNLKRNNQQSEDTTYRVWKYFLIISDKQLTHKEHNSIPRKQIGQLKNEKS
jgi:hypothetical protein